MKTAEDWVKKEDTILSTCSIYFSNPISLSTLTFSYESEHSDEQLIEFVKQIQWDTLKEVARLTNRLADEHDGAISAHQVVNGISDLIKKYIIHF